MTQLIEGQMLAANLLRTGAGAAKVDLAVDTDTLYIDVTNERIGINKVPTEALDVVGNAIISGSGNIANMSLVGNTIASTDVNGNIVLDPNGTGIVNVRAADNVVTTYPLKIENSAATGSMNIGAYAFNSLSIDINFNIDGTNILNLDRGTSTATFAGPVVVQGTFTSIGIDDNATLEVLQLEDGAIVFGENDASQFNIRRVSDTGTLGLSGGNGGAVGGNILLRGSTHATQGNDMLFRASANSWMIWDEDAGNITISTGVGAKTQALQIDNVLAATFAGAVDVEGAFTSLGIDDNATAERLQLSDTALTLGTAASAFNITNASDTLPLTIYGGTGAGNGSSIALFPVTHATRALDFTISSGTNAFLDWDESAGSLVLSAGTGAKTPALTIINDLSITFAGVGNFSSDVNVTSGAFTSRGIDDNATGERLQIADSIMEIGTAGSDYQLRMPGNADKLRVKGGTTGAEISLFGSTHASDWDWYITGNGTVLLWDESDGELEIFTGVGAKSLALTLNASQDISATGNFTILGGAGNNLVVEDGAAGITFDVDSATGNTDVGGVLTAASATLENLTTTRIPFATTGGAVIDSANLTFVTGSGALSVTGSLSVDNITVNGNDISITSGTELAINDGGLDIDFRVESDTDANCFVVNAGTNNVGIGIATPNAEAKLHIASNDSMIIPAGVTGERPGAPGTAALRWNTTTSTMEIWSGSSWHTVVMVNGAFVEKISGAGGTVDTETSALGIEVTGGFISKATGTAVGVTPVVVDSFPVASFRAAKYIVTVEKGTDYEVSEVLVVHDGTTASQTQYANVETNASLGSTSVAIVTGDVELSYTGIAVGNTVKVQTIFYMEV